MGPSTPEFLLNFAQVFLGLYVVVLAHELGHAVAAALSGHRVLGLFIGNGPRLLAFQVGRLAVQVRALPFGGAVAASLSRAGDWTRLREAALYAGGPLANLLMFAGLWTVSRPQGAWHEIDGWWSCVALLNLMFGVLNLLPFRSPAGLPSDGRRLMGIPFWSQRQVDEVSANAGLVEVLDTVDEGDLPAAVALAERLHARYPEQGSAAAAPGLALHRALLNQAARDRLLQDLSRAPDAARPAIKSALAYVDAILGSPAALDEAERLSAEALAELPHEPAVLHTRGAVLARLGRPREGLSLLERTGGLLSHPTDRANDHAFRSLALAALDRLPSARRHLACARRADPCCPLLEHVEARLDDRPASPPRAPLEPAFVSAEAIDRWRGWARALVLVSLLGVLASAGPAGVLGPLLLALALLVHPERSGVHALGVSLLAVAATDLLVLGHQDGHGPRPVAVALAVAAGLACLVMARWRREVDVPSRIARRVLAGLVVASGALIAYPLLRHLLFCSWLSHLHSFLVTFAQLGPLLVAFAAMLFAARRRWLALAGVLPAAMAVFLIVVSRVLPGP